MRLQRFSHVLRSLRFRLTAWNTLVMTAAIALALLAVRQSLRYTLIAEMDNLLVEDTAELGLMVQAFYPDLDQIHDEMNRKALGHEYRQLFVQVLDPAGLSVWSSVHTPADLRSGKAFSGDGRPRTVNGYRIVERKLQKSNLPPFTIQVGNSLEYVERDIAKLSQLMLLVAGGLLIVAPMVGYWLAGRATDPLGLIIRTAAGLRPIRADERLPLRNTHDELDELSQTINRLLDRIAEYLDRNRQFIANAAHELRSPLAAIQSSVEVALNSDRSTAHYKELLSDIVGQCGDLAVLVNQLLLLAESDSANAPIPQTPVRLDQVVQRSIEMFEGVAEERGIELQALEMPPALVPGDVGRLRQVVNNLVDNGLKFTERGGRVTLELSEDVATGRVRLCVADTGKGIPPGELPHIFERFYRGDKSRQREVQTTGNGLGLCICESIVLQHGGAIEAESRLGEGSTFDVYLPRYVEVPRNGSSS